MTYLKFFAQVATDFAQTLPPSVREPFVMVAEQQVRAMKSDADVAAAVRKERANNGGNPDQ